MKKLLFVCLGNICRSPAAEAIMQDYLRQQNRDDIYCDSAGTSAWHQGEKADSRMRAHGEKRDYKLLSRSRPFTEDDFEDFDYIFCMDQSNYKNVMALCRKQEWQKKVYMMCDFANAFNDKDVPDPYYGGEESFEYVFDLLEDCCQGVYKRLL